MRISFKKYIILVCVTVLSISAVAQIKVINNKGTFFQIDTSKWALVGVDIYNKNQIGNVGVGTFPYNARFVIDNGNSAILPVFKLKYPFSGTISDSILTWNPIDSTVRRVNTTVLLNNSWKTTGNSGTTPATNFIGTTDGQRLVFRTNNTEKMTILSNGNIGIGIAAPDATLHNNGSTINSVRNINNLPTGGPISAAPSSSVDIGTVFAVNQTTASQTLTLPNPTVTTAGRIVKVSNSGSASFSMYTITIAPSKFAEFMWTGSTWIPMTGGSSSVVNKKLVLSAEYAGAVVTPGNATPSHNGDLYGDNTVSTWPYSYYYMNYYEWISRSGSGPHSYQIIVRVTLPNDFTEWQTTNAIQYVHMAQPTCSVELDIYNVTTNTQIYNGSTLTSGSWTTTDIASSGLTNWVTPGQTVAIVITMRASTNWYFARIGDIILNYK